jgi:hypothetical protein
MALGRGDIDEPTFYSPCLTGLPLNTQLAPRTLEPTNCSGDDHHGDGPDVL